MSLLELVEKKRRYLKRWRRANREKANRYHLDYAKKRRVWIRSFLKKCVRCGATKKLMFHHRDPRRKVERVSQLWWASKDRLLAEIAKCDVLCYSCHNKHHWPQRRKAA